MVSRNVLKNGVLQTNTEMSLAFRDMKWMDLTVLQSLLGTIPIAVFAKVTGQSIWSPMRDHKLTICIAGLCNVLGNLAINAAFTISSSSAGHLIESLQPLVTFVVVTFVFTKMEVSNFISISLIVLGVVSLPVHDTSMTYLSLVVATISMLTFSIRNVLVKKLGDDWSDPLQKFIAVSTVSFLVIMPVWLVKVAITQKICKTKLLEFVTAGFLQPVYSIASFQVLESVSSPVTHAIAAILIRLVFYFDRIVYLTQEWKVLPFLLVVFCGVYLYLRKSKPSTSLIALLLTAVFTTLYFYAQYNLHTNPIADYDGKPNSRHHTRYNTTSMVWVFEKPINTENIKLFDAQNMSLNVYCGTTQCVKEVSALNQSRVTVEFVVISEIVKDLSLIHI